jgi:glycosyltransferase involved in cell wall biosynthesis
MPLVSVVMGVWNGEKRLIQTVLSILRQEDVELEFIVVDDGSSDNTNNILAELESKDSRLRVITTERRGLTSALISGCNAAKGDFIARQDANDISLPGRLSYQANILATSKETSFCSTRVRFVTDEGIKVFCTSASSNREQFGGIIHGSVMMRKDAYQRIGGYRKQFYYAQDVDLWERLKETGIHISVNRIYYEGLLFPESISGTKKREQDLFAVLIKNASSARKAGQDEDIWLNRAERISSQCRNLKTTRQAIADGNYFIGGCLIDSAPNIARKYLESALKANPRHLRARVRLMRLRGC